VIAATRGAPVGTGARATALPASKGSSCTVFAARSKRRRCQEFVAFLRKIDIGDGAPLYTSLPRLEWRLVPASWSSRPTPESRGGPRGHCQGKCMRRSLTESSKDALAKQADGRIDCFRHTRRASGLAARIPFQGQIMKRRAVIHRLGALGMLLARPLRAETGRIVIGQSAALSGPVKALGEEFRRGALLYFDSVNARGGVAGRELELRTLDDGYEPARCAANTRRLVDEGASVLFGYIGTPTSLAALPLATAAKLPFVAPFSGADALRNPFNRHVFHVRASYFDETAEIVKQATGIGIRRIGVFSQNDSYGQSGLAGVTRALKAQGMEPVGLGTVERNTVDVEAAVKSVLAGNPEAIVQISAYKACAAFIRSARAAGFTGTFYNVSFVGTKALAEELGAMARGVIVSQVMPFPYSASTPISGEYLAAGKAMAGERFEPNYTSIEGYVAARTLVAGLRHGGGNPTAEGIVKGLESLGNTDLGGFYIDFSAQKHTGSKMVDLTILTETGQVRR
jgi:ABC-type branched-subunit amino acid transport system substrate-binding protein